jgi:hypothetical protein
MDTLLAVLLLSVLVEALVENLKWTFTGVMVALGKAEAEDVETWSWFRAVALGLSVFFTVAYAVDAFALLGFKSQILWLGSASTGIIIARGSNWVYDWITKKIAIANASKK